MITGQAPKSDSFIPFQSPQWGIEFLFSEIAKIPGANPVMTPDNEIWVYGQTLFMDNDGDVFIHGKSPKTMLCFETYLEVMNFLLTFYESIDHKK